MAVAPPRSEAPARRVRLRRSDCGAAGILRRRRGRGFEYLDADGAAVRDAEVLERIAALAIPPAWREVWICPHPGGHIQATGIDGAGRKQYLYHQRWRELRDQEKFDDMVAFARTLPALRERVVAELDNGELDFDAACACAVRLLDRGFFRIGSEDYAVRNETYGLATIKKRHVRVGECGLLVFDYPAKHGKRRVQAIVDPVVAELVVKLKRRRGGGDELLAYRGPRRWHDLRSEDINAWLKQATGHDVSAKDFRTWGATVLAAVALAVSRDARSTTARRRAVTRAIAEVARYLGNTPAVARGSYIDPRVIDHYLDGRTIDTKAIVALDVGADDLTAIQGPVEEAVLELLS